MAKGSFCSRSRGTTRQGDPGQKIFLFGNSMGGIGSEILGIQKPGYVDGIILSVSAVTLANPPRRTNALGYMMGCAFYYLHDHYQEFAEPVLILCAEDDMHFKPDDMLKFYLNCASEDKVFHSYGHAPHKLFGSEAGPEALQNMLTWLDLRA